MIRVSSREDAWMIAKRLFPTDYTKDSGRSTSAGHDIYYSTAEGVGAWISDLNDRLELNYPNGTTENIWISDGVTFRELLMTVEMNTPVKVITSVFGMMFSTEHYAWRYLRTENSEFDALAQRQVIKTRVADGVLEVVLR